MGISGARAFGTRVPRVCLKRSKNIIRDAYVVNFFTKEFK
jgi:hypothetical protein